jgi:hypothetical protein
MQEIYAGVVFPATAEDSDAIDLDVDQVPDADQ